MIVVDLKTGTSIPVSTALQTAGYKILYNSRDESSTLMFDEPTHTYRVNNGVKVASVTEVLSNVLAPYVCRAPSIDVSIAAAFGRAVHTACAYHALGVLNNAVLDPKLRPYLEAFISARKFLDLKFVAVETPIFSAKYNLAGTPDFIADNGKAKVTQRLAILLMPDERFKVVEYSDAADVTRFTSALNVFQWKRKQGA